MGRCATIGMCSYSIPQRTAVSKLTRVGAPHLRRARERLSPRDVVARREHGFAVDSAYGLDRSAVAAHDAYSEEDGSDTSFGPGRVVDVLL